MSQKTNKQDLSIVDIGHDDYSLSRVPQSARYSWFNVALQRFGQLATLSQFLLGATLGAGMNFWPAFWAITLGTVILEIVAIFSGIAGQREGLSTSVLSRWSGFGQFGSTLIGLIIAISLIGWFGIQNGVFASGLSTLIGILPVWAWSIVTGLIILLVVIYGFRFMGWLAYVTVPAFLLLVCYSIFNALQNHSIAQLIASPHVGPTLSIAAGTTIVAGGYITGAVITPDMTRYNRSVADVVKQSILSIVLGQYPIGLLGVVLAHMLKSSNIVSIVTSTSGFLGTLILIMATLKINDWNLYSSSLGFVNSIDAIFKVRVNRVLVTIVVGILGTFLSAIGFLNQFAGFLTILGVSIPPIASIMVVDYFLLRRSRDVLDESRARDALPRTSEIWNPIGIAAWIIASVLGYTIQWGIPVLNSLLCSAILYFVGVKLWMLIKPKAATLQVEEQRQEILE